MTRQRAFVVAVVTLATLVAVGVVRRGDGGGPSSRTETAKTTAPRPPSQGRLVTQASIKGLPLRGVPLQSPTRLHLLVADAPAPFILDVDRGTAQPITGLPAKGERGVSVLPLGQDALVLSTRYCNRCRESSAYLLRHGSTTATRLGTVLEAVPSRDGQGVWALTRGSRGHCMLGEIGLDGRPRRQDSRVSCRTGPLADLPAGLLTSFTGPLGTDAHSELLRSEGGVVRFGDPHPQPVVGNLVLSGGDRRTPLLLHDMSSGSNERLRWPSRPGYGLGEVTGQPNGPLATVDFAKYSPVYRFDLWLLDTATGRWQQLPDMPAGVVPKATDVKWTGDGRVMILTSNALGVWRPGETRLQVRRVKPPKQPGIEFVVW